MKYCDLDGARLATADQVYDALSAAFGFPAYFGRNPDALWDALGDYRGEPVTVRWRDAARSAAILGPRFAQIAAVLRRAADEELLTLQLG